MGMLAIRSDYVYVSRNYIRSLFVHSCYRAER